MPLKDKQKLKKTQTLQANARDKRFKHMQCLSNKHALLKVSQCPPPTPPKKHKNKQRNNKKQKTQHINKTHSLTTPTPIYCGTFDLELFFY